ncbi:M48 family metalloprotease [Arenicella sp. 4NH20-0111]|uniref:M48 family metalloprotease n=1 Tax=Arenicella sp. 4NH20-0111 TaxID=3127648 RepID=UPI003104D8CF
MSRFGPFIFIAIALLLLQGCSTNPVTGKRQLAMSESWEISTGRANHPKIMQEYSVYDDPELQAYVNDIGQRLAKKSHRSNLDFTFTLLDSPQVNAFALPGGFIYITRGIMSYMTKEAHLAGVIGHEIGHVTAAHGAQRAAQSQLGTLATVAVAIGTGSQELAQASQMFGGALISGYGREQELQSDRLGAEYIAQNNYSPDDMVGVIGILKDQELFAQEKARAEGRQVQGYHGLFSTHPKNDRRLQEAVAAADKYRDTTKPVPDDGEFLRLTNGMAYGESEKQGITRGNKFYHKALDLFVEFPDGWSIQNTPSVLAAIAPDRSKLIQMKMDSVAPPVDGVRYLGTKFPQFRDATDVQTHEDMAVAGVATISDKQTGQQQNLRVAMVTRGNQAYVISGVGKSQPPNQEFFDVAKSVRRLKPSERKLAEGRSIKLIKAKRGDTIASLARKSNLDKYAQAQIRLINGLYPDGEPKAGQMIKIIQ